MSSTRRSAGPPPWAHRPGGVRAALDGGDRGRDTLLAGLERRIGGRPDRMGGHERDGPVPLSGQASPSFVLAVRLACAAGVAGAGTDVLQPGGGGQQRPDVGQPPAGVHRAAQRGPQDDAGVGARAERVVQGGPDAGGQRPAGATEVPVPVLVDGQVEPAPVRPVLVGHGLVDLDEAGEGEHGRRGGHGPGQVGELAGDDLGAAAVAVRGQWRAQRPGAGLSRGSGPGSAAGRTGPGRCRRRPRR